MPLAAGWRVPTCDLVVSLSHCVAKAAAPPPGVPHVCYCFTPMRYAWHMRDAYFGRGRSAGCKARLRRPAAGRAARLGPAHGRPRDALRRHQPRRCSDRIARVLRPRQRRHLPAGRHRLLHARPPVPREDYYLVVSAFAPYKRIDLAVDGVRAARPASWSSSAPGRTRRGCRRLAGPTRRRSSAGSRTRSIRDHLRRCRALLFPGEEDFGIVPVEAQACGAPVIAFGRGGATETVRAARRRGRADRGAVRASRPPTAWSTRSSGSRRTPATSTRRPPAGRRCASTRGGSTRSSRRFLATLDSRIAASPHAPPAAAPACNDLLAFPRGARTLTRGHSPPACTQPRGLSPC